MSEIMVATTGLGAYTRNQRRRTALAGLGCRRCGISGFGAGFGGGPLDSMKDLYKKAKAKVGAINLAKPEPETVVKSLLNSMSLVAATRDAVRAAYNKGVNVDELIAAYQARSQQLNALSRELQSNIQAKTGKHVSVPILLPFQSDKAVDFQGLRGVHANKGYGEGFGFLVIVAAAAVAAVGVGVPIAMAYAKKLNAETKKSEAFAETANKYLAQKLADPSIPDAEKVKLLKDVAGTIEQVTSGTPEAETGNGKGSKMLDKIKGFLLDKTGIAALAGTAGTAVVIVGGAAAAWTAYRLATRQPIIPSGRGVSGFGGFGASDQRSRFAAAAHACKGQGSNFKSCMSRQLTGGGGGSMGGFSGAGKKRGGGRGRAMSPAMKTQQNKMRAGAKRCKGTPDYRACITEYLRG